MNKIISGLFIASSAIAFTGCVAEEADIFDKSAAERLNEISDLYTRRLAANGGTWIMEYYPSFSTDVKLGNGHLFPCRFAADRSVLMAMNDSVSDNVYKESVSTWEVITDDGPVLTFNTFNDVLHTFSDPEIDIKETSDNERGKGYEGDYEFVIKDLQENASVAMLKGKKRGVYCRMTHIPADTDFKAYLDDVKDFAINIFPEKGHDLFINVGDDKYRVQKMYNHLPNIYPANGDAVIDSNISPYLISNIDGKYHLRFRDAIGSGSNQEQEFIYDAEGDCFRGVSSTSNVLCGPEPKDYFNEVLSEITNIFTPRHAWRLNRKSLKSPAFAINFNKVVDEVKQLGNGVSFSDMYFYREYKSDKLNLCIEFNQGSQTSYAIFVFDCKETEQGIQLQYVEPYEQEVSKAFLEFVPSVSGLLADLSLSVKMDPSPSRFDLNKIRCTSTTNEEMWFVLDSYYNRMKDK